MSTLFRTEQVGGKALSRANATASLLTLAWLAGTMLVLQALNSLTGSWLTQHLGITPRTVEGLLGILFAPLLHASWSHLWSNLALVVVFGFLVRLGGPTQFAGVTAVIWLVSGLGIWLTAPAGSVTIGASVLVFGWLAYLVVRGFLRRAVGQILLGILLLAIWGSIFWTGIALAAFGPGSVSWQGHLFGALGGVLAAWLVARADGTIGSSTL